LLKKHHFGGAHVAEQAMKNENKDARFFAVYQYSIQ